MDMKYILGIDQGGSKTHAIVLDETGRILGLGKSYGACHSVDGLEYAVEAIRLAAAEAIEKAGLSVSDISVAAGGLTGIDWEYEGELLEGELQKLFPDAKVKAVNDCIIALRAATAAERCGILCAGSGLNCAVYNGEECFVYGYFVPDEFQGGWSLGKRAVQAVFDSYLGLVGETALTERLLTHFHAKDVEELLYKQVNGQIKTEEYLKVPLILQEEACRGDKVTGEIWKLYAGKLAAFLSARAEKMRIADKAMDVVLSGSIFKCRYEGFQDTIRTEILKGIPNARIIAAEYEPIIGAAVIGLKMIYGEIPDEVSENMKKSSEQYPVRRLERK